MPKSEMLGAFEQIVLLALLRLRDNAYGVTIRHAIVERMDRNVSLGAVYATLERLEEKGYVSSHMGDPTPERGGRPKRYFKIEAPGKRALVETDSAMQRMRQGLKLAGA